MGETLVTGLIEDTRARQRARRLAVREFRPRRTALGIGAALLVTVAGWAVTIELVAAEVGVRSPLPGDDRAAAALHRLTWEDPKVQAVAAVLAVAGVALLLAALPGRMRVVALDGTDPRLAGGLSRAALRRTLAHAALAVPGIERARVRTRGVVRRRLVVRVATRYRNPANLVELVHVAMNERLDSIEPIRRPRTDVRLTWQQT